MKIKEKPCKAMGKARGYDGCGTVVYKRTHGLCDKCYTTWLLNTPEGQEKLSRSILQAPKTREKVEKAGWNSRKQIMKDKLKTKQDYINELQVVFNEWIRLRDKGLPCISCQKPAKKENAGHYRSVGSSPQLRFEPLNNNLQCEYCNTHLHANLINYRIHLIKKIGLEKVEWLETEHPPKHYSIPELVLMKVEYREKIRKLK